jgi:hypothetical protein
MISPSAKPASRDDLATLCRSCGRCCDGSLFGRVPLQPDEAAAARRNRLPVLDGGKGFAEPCTALAVSGAGVEEWRTCSIYDERPRSCRTFVCRLYDRHRREGGPIEDRLAVVRQVRQLVAYLEASGLKPSDFDGRSTNGPRNTEAENAYAELTRSLEEDFARA